jgi:DNA-binding MarR family transcriptional regulator
MPEPRWLTDEEQQTWRAFLLATQLLTDQLDHELQHDAGIPLGYYGILVVLAEQPERALRMSEIAALLHFSKSRLSHAIARLEDRGWVQRAVCSTDRRGASAALTDAGLAALMAAAPRHVEGVRRHLFDRLTPAQVRQLRTIGDAIAAPLVEAIEAREDDGPTGHPSRPPPLSAWGVRATPLVDETR